MRLLTEKHFEKLAVITDTPLEKISELNSMGLIDEMRAMDVIIRYDWNLLKRSQARQPVSYRIKALAAFYSTNERRIKQAIYSKSKNGYYCKECGRHMSRREYLHGKGVCPECAVKSIIIE